MKRPVATLRGCQRVLRAAWVGSMLLAGTGLVAAGLLVATAVYVLRASPGEWSVPATVGPFALRLSAPALLRLATHPLGIRLLDGKRLTTRFGTIHAEAGPTPSSLVLRCVPCTVRSALLAREPLRIAQVEARIERGEPNELQGSVRVGRIDATWKARLAAGGADLDIDVLDAPVADFVALFASAVPEADVVQIDGWAGARLRLALPTGRYTIEPRLVGLRVAGLGTEALIGAVPQPACARPPRVGRRPIGFGAWLPRAVLAAEDQRFFEHPGYDLAEMTAAWSSFDEDRADHRRRGASTLTQQLAKLLYTGDEPSVARKLRELLYAAELERTLGKARILQRYLAVAPWGDGQCGGEAAALHYFGRHAATLSPAEAVWLAHLLRNPAAALDADAQGNAATPRRLDNIAEGLRPMRRADRAALKEALAAWTAPPVVQARRLPPLVEVTARGLR